MARTLSSATQTEVAKRLGIEPINIIGIDWLSNGTEVKYADKDLPGIAPRILSIGSIDEILKLDTGNPSVSLEIKLDDSDNGLKTLLTTTNIHKKKCTIYQTFGGLNLSDAFSLFKGEISTPVIYDEGEKTLTFTILSKVDSRQVGFAPEEGQFASVSESLVGKVWPLAFGDVVNIPAVKSSETLDGTVGSLFGIIDYTLPWKRDLLLLNLIAYQNAIIYYDEVLLQAQSIARAAGDIIVTYTTLIRNEDTYKQAHEDLATLENTYKEQLKQAVELYKLANTEDTRDTALDSINAVLAILNPVEVDLLANTVVLKSIEAEKEAVNIETQNADLKYKTIGDLREKFKQMFENYMSTLVELLKVEDAMIQQLRLNRTQFLVIDGDKFPQSQEVTLIGAGLKIVGSFAGKVFTATDIRPRYSNVYLGPREDTSILTLIDTFWIQDPTLILKGNYCLLTTGDIIKVIDQTGTKCVFELVERHIDDAVLKPYEPSDVTDLPTSVWLMLAGASEHTTQEKVRILKESLGTDQSAFLTAIENNIKALVTLFGQADNDQAKRDVAASIFTDLAGYTNTLARLKFPKKAVDEATRIISQEEFSDLLALYNLELKEYFRALQPVITNLIDWYYITGTQVSNIAQVSPVILPTWLPFDNNQTLSDFTIVPELLVENHILIRKMPRSTFWQLAPGDTIVLESSLISKYIANTLPSGIVSVYAYRNINGYKKLVPVPSEYYFFNENESYGALHCTTVTLYRKLTDFQDEGWEEQIYVSLISSIGPNVIDILTWIVQNYTSYTVDATTFTATRIKIANYPAGFCLFDKKDAITLLEEIAWQLRCVIYVRENIVYIKYISEDPSSIQTITQADIQEKTLQVSYSSTEDLVTKFIATWKGDYAIEKDNTTILRYNINNYGEVEKTFDFYIYNIADLVLKSATFWLIRYANTWKKVTFKTFLTNLKLETLDTITLNLGSDFVSTGTIVATIEKCNYDTDNNLLEIDCWVPIRAGEMTKYNFAYPAGLAVDVMFPTVDDVLAGNAGSGQSNVPTGADFTITGPSDITAIALRPKDYGKIFQSDAADISPLSPLIGLSLGNNYSQIANYLQRDRHLFRPANALANLPRGDAVGERPNQLGNRNRLNAVMNPALVAPPGGGPGPAPGRIAANNPPGVGNIGAVGRVDTRICIGQIKEYSGFSQTYSVVISSGETLDVYEIGFDVDNVTPIGTFVQVIYNQSNNLYQMIKGLEVDYQIYFCNFSTPTLPDYDFVSGGLTATVDGELEFDDIEVWDGIVLLYNPEDSTDSGLWRLSQGTVSTRWSMTRLGTASRSEHFDRGQIIYEYRSGIVWELKTVAPITLNTTSLTYGKLHNDTYLVRAASTVNIDVNSAPSSVNSITLVVDNVILLTAQTTGSENGLYYFRGTGEYLARIIGANRSFDFNYGQLANVREGTNKGLWRLVTAGITLDSTSLVYTRISSPLTTKGDIWGFSTTDIRVPIGTDGQVATADSASTPGWKWATPSGGSGSIDIYQREDDNSDTLVVNDSPAIEFPTSHGFAVEVSGAGGGAIIYQTDLIELDLDPAYIGGGTWTSVNTLDVAIGDLYVLVFYGSWINHNEGEYLRINSTEPGDGYDDIPIDTGNDTGNDSNFRLVVEIMRDGDAGPAMSAMLNIFCEDLVPAGTPTIISNWVNGNSSEFSSGEQFQISNPVGGVYLNRVYILRHRAVR